MLKLSVLSSVRAILLFMTTLCLLPAQWVAQKYQVPYFIHQCSKSDPRLDQCLTESANHLARSFQRADFLNVCKRHDPELNKCITDTVEELRPILKTGSEGFIPSLEPLYIREIVVTEGSGLKIIGKDVKAHGSSDFALSNLQADMDKLDFEFDLDFPMMYIEAQYNINGRVILIPIQGNGPLKGNFTDIKAHIKLNGDLVDKDNAQFMNFTKMDINLRIGHGKIKLENLFGGEKVLGDAVNAAINANFDQFLNELRRPLQKALGEVLLEISNDCVNGFTLDQLSPLE